MGRLVVIWRPLSKKKRKTGRDAAGGAVHLRFHQGPPQKRKKKEFGGCKKKKKKKNKLLHPLFPLVPRINRIKEKQVSQKLLLFHHKHGPDGISPFNIPRDQKRRNEPQTHTHTQKERQKKEKMELFIVGKENRGAIEPSMMYVRALLTSRPFSLSLSLLTCE